jgi:hypothetical protein
MLGDLLLGNYKQIAEQLGLTIDGGVGQDHLMIHGAVDGNTVEMWFGTHVTHTRARLAHHAPEPMSIVTRSWLSRLFGRAHGIGDPKFDARFVLRRGDRDRIGALVSEDARRELVDLAKQRLHPELAHDRVQLRMFSNGGTDAPAKILKLLHATSHLGKTVDALFAR